MTAGRYDQPTDAPCDRHADLFEFAPVAYLLHDAAGNVTAANMTACTLLEVQRGSLLGRALLEWIAAEDRPALLEHLRGFGADPGRHRASLAVHVVTASGRRLSVHLSTHRSPSPDVPFGTTLTDVTERRHGPAGDVDRRDDDIDPVSDSRVRERARAQDLERLTRELQESDRRKNDFLTMLAHELRNPLSPIRSAIEILRLEGISEAERHEMRDIIERQITYMARLIDDLLDVSRISRGKILLRREAVDLSDLIRNVALDLRFEAEAAGLIFTVDVPREPLWTEGDPVRLSQVAGNLLHNAVKFTDPGGAVMLRLAASDDGRSALITVTDTGVGMEPEMLSAGFGAFTQADRSLDRSRGGLGLGLALVKGLVDMHGGEVTAASEGTGKGSTFTVRLSLCAAPQEVAVPVPAIDAVRSLRVLVVDDRRDSLVTMSKLLKTLGHDVATAGDGEEGLLAAREFLPDVMFSDIGLPRLDGYALARTVRSEPQLASTFLVAVTGYGSPEDRRRAEEAGFDYHLTKPVSFDDLREALSAVAQQQG